MVIHINKYSAKTLFTGYKLNLKTEKMYVAVPKTLLKKECVVHHNGKKMTILKGKKPEHQETFDDKYGRKDNKGNLMKYTLCYFQWIPDKENTTVSLFGGFQNMPDDKKQKFLEGVKKALHKSTI